MSSLPVVNSHNEWDHLEEVIVGVVDGTVVSPWEPGHEAMVPTQGLEEIRDYHLLYGGQPFTEEQLAPARNGMRELSALEPGQQVPDLRHASLPPVRPPVRTSKVIVDGLRQATVREASRRMHHLNPAGLPCDLRLRRSTNQS